MSTTLAKTKVSSVSAVAMPEPAAINTEMTVSLMPPGFTEPVSRPIVFIGGEVEGGMPFYTWNHNDNAREYVPVNRFSATLMEVKTIIKNGDDELKRAVKLVCEFETASGQRVAMSAGANTYAALGIVGGLSNLTSEQLQGEIGLSGKVGRNGKVTFVSVFADGQLARNPDAEELLKAAKKDGTVVELIEGYLSDINEKIKLTF